jgi:hypothetical protein
MSKRKSRDPLVLEIARDMERRGLSPDIELIDTTLAKWDPLVLEIARDMERCGSHTDVESIEATLAEFRAPKQGDAVWAAFDQIEQSLRRTRTVLDQLLAAQPRQRAAALFREREARAAELRRSGVRNPVAQAEKEIAEREGFASGPAFNRWLRRRRDQDKKSG